VRLLLDECVGGRLLRDSLAASGHDTLLSLDALGGGADDMELLAFALQDDRAILTYNTSDFVVLADETPRHAGIILVFHGDQAEDVTTPEIVRALGNVAASHPDGLWGSTIVLNAYLA
jgi:predicted nuclease of predicted toxin-antitoxin system